LDNHLSHPVSDLNPPRIYVLNLPDATDRLEYIDRQLRNLKLPYKTVSGIKGTQLSPSEITRAYDRKANASCFRRPLSIGEIGCYLSHRQAWQNIITEELPWALILEDDIEIAETLPDLLAALPKFMPFDLVKLSDNRKSPKVAVHKLNDHFQWVSYSRIPNCANGYILSNDGAQKMLSRKQFFRPVDIDMQFYPELNLSVSGLFPYTISSSQAFTSIIDQQNGGSRKTLTWPWRNWRFRAQLFWLRKTKVSADLKKLII
jgi:glycosyl transferase family 25